MEQETQETIEVKEEPKETKTEEKPEGWDQVELTPEQQKRFNRLYGQVKGFERTIKDYEKIMREQSELLDKLDKNQNVIVNHLQETDFVKTEKMLKEQRKEAFNKGDLETYDDLTDKINDIKIQKKLSEKEVKEPRKKVTSGEDFVNRGIQKGTISEEDLEVYRAWASETDENGNLLRPWVNAADFRSRDAVMEGSAVFNKSSFVNKPFADKLKEIDRRMGIENQRATGGVLPGGNLTRGKSTNTIKLSPQEEHIALKTRFAGPGKSSQEHIEAYRKQIAKMRG